MRINLFGNLRITLAGRPVTAVNTNRLHSLIAYLILHGMEAIRALGAEVRLPYYFALLAETLMRAGLCGEALASLSSGFAFVSKNGEEWPAAELFRMQGTLLAAEGKADAALAAYRRGIQSARQCGSLAFERKLSILADRTLAAGATERL